MNSADYSPYVDEVKDLLSGDFPRVHCPGHSVKKDLFLAIAAGQLIEMRFGDSLDYYSELGLGYQLHYSSALSDLPLGTERDNLIIRAKLEWAFWAIRDHANPMNEYAQRRVAYWLEQGAITAAIYGNAKRGSEILATPINDLIDHIKAFKAAHNLEDKLYIEMGIYDQAIIATAKLNEVDEHLLDDVFKNARAL